MSSKTTLELSKLIKNIVDARTINEILTTYDTQLKADNQYDLNAMFPILMEEMQVVNSTYKKALTSQVTFQQTIENFMVLVKKVTTEMGALNNAIVATDPGSSVVNKAQKLNKQFEKFFYATQALRNLSNDELSDSTVKVAIPEITSMHQTINETIINGTQSDDWVISKVEKFAGELYGDVRNLSTDALRKEMSVFYDSLQGLIIATNELYSILIRKKASNPLISDEIITLITLINKNVVKLDAMYVNSLNLVYVHADDLLGVNNAVLAYKTLVGKLSEQK